MRTLYLLRHAKASQAAGGIQDHERPLAPEGIAAATALGAYLKARGHRLGYVVCSTSRRTVETYENLARAFPGLEATLEPRIYETDSKQLLAIVRALPAQEPSATVIGHNPGMAELALALAGGGDLNQLAEMAAKFPPGAIAKLEFETDRWQDVAPGSGTLSLFRSPKDVVGA